MSTVSFLSAKAWIDKDGRHIWFSHECAKGRDTSMLPFPQWRVHPDGRRVEPSFNCQQCGCHVVLELEQTECCPKCGGDEVERFKHSAIFSLPECWYKYCPTCEHQWDHS